MRRTTEQACATVLVSFLVLGYGACKKAAGPQSVSSDEGASTMKTKRENFGRLADGTPVEIFTLTNAHGLQARIMTYGGILVSLKVPDRNGALADVNLGFDGLAGYLG